MANKKKGNGRRFDQDGDNEQAGQQRGQQTWQRGMRDGKAGSLTPFEQMLGGRAYDLGPNEVVRRARQLDEQPQTA